LETHIRDRKPARQSGLTRIVYLTGLGLILALIAVVGSLWLWVNDPLDLQPPKDSDLIALFSRQKSIFERIVTMAHEDGERGWLMGANIPQRTVPVERVKSYETLTSELGPNVNILWENKSGTVLFTFQTGGSLLAVGAEWWKGIEYIPTLQEEDGTLMPRLDGARRLAAGVYLRKIDQNWFLLYERVE
jgi:hypothetical protein